MQLRAYVAALESQLRLLGHSQVESDGPILSETRPFSCPPPSTYTPREEMRVAEDESRPQTARGSIPVETGRVSRNDHASRAASLIEATRKRQQSVASPRASSMIETSRRGTLGETGQSMRGSSRLDTSRHSMTDGMALGSPVKGRRPMSGRRESGVMAG